MNFTYENGQLAIIVVLAACLIVSAMYCINLGLKISRKQREIADLETELKYNEAKSSEIGNLINKRGDQLKALNDELLTVQSKIADKDVQIAAKDERIAELMAILDKENRQKDAEGTRYWSLEMAGKARDYLTPDAYVSAARRINRYLREAK